MAFAFISVCIGLFASICVFAVVSYFDKQGDCPGKSASKYGHPLDPVEEIKKRLKSPPPGFYWELTVKNNNVGDPVLRLGLLDLAANEVDFMVKHLVYGRNGGNWVEWYKGQSRERGLEQFRTQIIDPIIQFADEQYKLRVMADRVEHHEVIG